MNWKSKRQRGMSMVEVMVALGVVGAGAYIAINASKFISTHEKSANKSSSMTLVNQELLKGAMRMLNHTTDGNKNVNGVCKIVNSDAIAPGVGSIYINLGNPSAIFTGARWSELLPNWDSTTSQECNQKDKAWGRCLAIKSVSNMNMTADQLKKLNVVGDVRITPVNMNSSLGMGLFQEIPVAIRNKNTDVKNVGFIVEASVFFNKENGEGREQKELKDFVWAPSVGTCDYRLANGTQVKLSLAGTGASDPEGKTVYNRSGFGGNKKIPLEVSFNKSQAQEGLLSENGQYITTNSQKNIYGSCNEVLYRCPQENSNNREYDAVKYQARLKYNTDNQLTNSTSMNANFKFSFKKGGSSGMRAGGSQDVRYAFDGKELSESEMPLNVNGSHELLIAVTDKGSSNANGLCRSVCRKDSNYNKNGTDYVDRFSPFLEYVFSGFNSKGFVDSSTEELGCTACFMKSCDQFGLGTFGKMDEMPNQPLDSIVPECSLKESSATVFGMNPYFKANKVGGNWADSSKKCIAAKLNSTQDGFEYSAESCSEQLPVMCYNYGTFLLARDVTLASEQLAKVSFGNANDRCVLMGMETTPAQELRDFIGTPNLPFPVEGANFKYLNLAQQGFFLAPQLPQDYMDFNKWREERKISSDTKFWVAMKKDGNDFAVIPPAVSAKAETGRFAVFFDGRGSLTYRDYKFNLGLAGLSGTTYGAVLANHLKYKGLKAANENDPFGNGDQLKFLCRKKSYPFDLFISNQDSKEQNKGDMICASEGGVFAPPTSAVSWVKALTLVTPIHKRHAFPNPEINKAEDVEVVWVALKGNSSDVTTFEPYNSSYLKNIGDTSIYTPESVDGDVRLMDGDGKFHDPKAQLIGNTFGSIKMDPNVRFRVRINDDTTIEVLFNPGGTAKKEYSADEVVNMFNTAAGSRAKMEKANLGPLGLFKNFRIKSLSAQSNSEVKILTGGAESELGFGAGQTAYAPNSQRLCYKDNGYLESRNKDYNCGANSIAFDTVKDSKNFHVNFGIHDFNGGMKFRFGN